MDPPCSHPETLCTFQIDALLLAYLPGLPPELLGMARQIEQKLVQYDELIAQMRVQRECLISEARQLREVALAAHTRAASLEESQIRTEITRKVECDHSKITRECEDKIALAHEACDAVRKKLDASARHLALKTQECDHKTWQISQQQQDLDTYIARVSELSAENAKLSVQLHKQEEIAAACKSDVDSALAEIEQRDRTHLERTRTAEAGLAESSRKLDAWTASLSDVAQRTRIEFVLQHLPSIEKYLAGAEGKIAALMRKCSTEIQQNLATLEHTTDVSAFGHAMFQLGEAKTQIAYFANWAQQKG